MTRHIPKPEQASPEEWDKMLDELESRNEATSEIIRDLETQGVDTKRFAERVKAVVTSAPLSRCELCNQFEPMAEMYLFIVRNKCLVATDNRGWEGKAGVRHVCPACVNEVRQA